MIPRILTVLLLACLVVQSNAQVSLKKIMTVPDSVPTLNRDEFYKLILNFHPTVKQAGLLTESAQQEIRLARGQFDPKLGFNFEHKEFNDKTYFSKVDASLSFPSWFPVNPKIGVENHRGQLLDPEETIPGNQQLYAGVVIPLGQGLFTDARRTAVKQALLFRDLAEAEQVSYINKILLQAAKDYWYWYYTYYHLRLTEQAAQIAGDIFSRVKLQALEGESSLMDTVQARITWQTRLIERQEAELAFRNAGLEISNYLWNEKSEPVDLPKQVIPPSEDPDKADMETLENVLARARERHPELLKLKSKIGQLEAERDLAKELLKPRLDVSYAALGQPNVNPVFDPLNDYKVGMDFSFPIFLRKERSKLSLTRIKIQSTQYLQQQTVRDITTEVNTAYNDLQTTLAVLSRQAAMVDLYDRLLTAELLNLENGESDLFKINIQQEKLLAAQSKWVKLKSEAAKQKAVLYWSAGIRPDGETNK